MSSDLDTLIVLDHLQIARSNMIAAYHGGSTQNRKRELGKLRQQRLLFAPEEQKDNGNYRYSPRLYAVASAGNKRLIASGIQPSETSSFKHWKHMLMISDIVLSLATACKARGLRFRFQKDIIGNAPLSFKSNISYDFPKTGYQTYDGDLEPDYLFAIEDLYFVLEADRKTENIVSPNFKNKSWLRCLLQYRYVLKAGDYKAVVPNMMVLSVTTNDIHALNILSFMYGDLNLSSQSLLFTAAAILGSRDNYPEPLTYLLDYPLARAGHPDFIISEELKNGR
jgi:hypothetical protein